MRRLALPGEPGDSGRPFRAAFALIVVTLAVFWIGESVVAPMSPFHSATALLRGSEADRSAPVPSVLQAPDAAAVERARALVAREPLAAEAYAVLALAAQHAGQDQKAARLMAIAAAWWPRDLLVQSWLLDRSLRRGDRQAAIARFDVITRVRPDSLDAMADALTPILADPAAAAILAKRLEGRPPWRSRFIDISIRLWRNPAALISLMDRLQRQPGGLDATELQPYLIKLVATGAVDQAYLAWLRSLPGPRRESLGFLYNGHFQYPLSDMPFDWQLPPVPNVRTSLTGEAGRRVLTIGFLGGPVALAPIQHDLILSPGSYRLTGRVMTDRLRTDQGIRWSIACREHPDRALASSELFKDSTPWRDFAMDFTLPEDGCVMQILSLGVDARLPEEQQVSGIARFSGLDIEPR